MWQGESDWPSSPPTTTKLALVAFQPGPLLSKCSPLNTAHSSSFQPFVKVLKAIEPLYIGALKDEAAPASKRTKPNQKLEESNQPDRKRMPKPYRGRQQRQPLPNLAWLPRVKEKNQRGGGRVLLPAPQTTPPLCFTPFWHPHELGLQVVLAVRRSPTFSVGKRDHLL